MCALWMMPGAGLACKHLVKCKEEKKVSVWARGRLMGGYPAWIGESSSLRRTGWCHEEGLTQEGNKHRTGTNLFGVRTEAVDMHPYPSSAPQTSWLLGSAHDQTTRYALNLLR
jgi:hypothetical protein